MGRDYSVYVIDPLEAQPPPMHDEISASFQLDPTASSSSAPQAAALQRGVAVGLGLMSWALLATADRSVIVVGTFQVDAIGRRSLEVVFSLKEVR